MKKIVAICSLLLLYAVHSSAQGYEGKNQFLIDSEGIPTLTTGLEKEFQIDNKGKNILTLRVISVEYSDSTNMSCILNAKILATIKGKEFKFNLLANDYGINGIDIVRRGKSIIKDGIVLQEGDEQIIEMNTYLRLHAPFVIIVNYEVGKVFKEVVENSFAKVPAYDKTEYVEKQYAAYMAKEREKQEALERSRLQRAKEDSLRTVGREHQEMLLTPEYLANWIGASFFTKESIEKDCCVEPMAYNGGLIMYDFSKCPVSMAFDDASNVCVEISFRLFGEDGYQMKRDLINYGYKLQSKSTGDLIIENNFQNVQTGTTSIYKCKLKNGGYSTCRITEGQAMMFTFFRTKK